MLQLQDPNIGFHEKTRNKRGNRIASVDNCAPCTTVQLWACPCRRSACRAWLCSPGTTDRPAAAAAAAVEANRILWAYVLFYFHSSLRCLSEMGLKRRYTIRPTYTTPLRKNDQTTPTKECADLDIDLFPTSKADTRTPGDARSMQAKAPLAFLYFHLPNPTAQRKKAQQQTYRTRNTVSTSPPLPALPLLTRGPIFTSSPRRLSDQV